MDLWVIYLTASAGLKMRMCRFIFLVSLCVLFLLSAETAELVFEDSLLHNGGDSYSENRSSSFISYFLLFLKYIL